MGVKGKAGGFSVKVIKNVVVVAEQAWHDHWLPFSNLDLLVPPFDVGSFFCYTKPTLPDPDFTTLLNALHTSLSQALALYYPLAGEIIFNAVGEPEIHCNNRGVDFTHAEADVNLTQLNFYNPDESIDAKLMPARQCGVLAIQVTKLKCGGMVIGCMFDHRVADGYSANMFISSWADMAQSKSPSTFPSFRRSILNPRRPGFYASSIDELFVPFSSLPPPDLDFRKQVKYDEGDSLANRIYYIEGEQLKRLQLLASENGCRRSKLEAFTSFLWKITALCMADSGNQHQMCRVAVAVDGRKRLSEGEGDDKQRLMDSHFGNVLSMPFGGKTSEELNERALSWVAKDVHEFLTKAATKQHFMDLIDWVEEQRPQPLVSRPFADGENATAIMVSSGQRFPIMEKMDFGWGKLVFGSCHVPSSRRDCYVMTLPSPNNRDDWVVYMHMPLKHLNYIETHASHMFKPLTAHYLNL